MVLSFGTWAEFMIEFNTQCLHKKKKITIKIKKIFSEIQSNETCLIPEKFSLKATKTEDENKSLRLIQGLKKKDLLL